MDSELSWDTSSICKSLCLSIAMPSLSTIGRRRAELQTLAHSEDVFTLLFAVFAAGISNHFCPSTMSTFEDSEHARSFLNVSHSCKSHLHILILDVSLELEIENCPVWKDRGWASPQLKDLTPLPWTLPPPPSSTPSQATKVEDPWFVHEFCCKYAGGRWRWSLAGCLTSEEWNYT